MHKNELDKMRRLVQVSRNVEMCYNDRRGLSQSATPAGFLSWLPC